MRIIRYYNYFCKKRKAYTPTANEINSMKRRYRAMLSANKAISFINLFSTNFIDDQQFCWSSITSIWYIFFQDEWCKRMYVLLSKAVANICRISMGFSTQKTDNMNYLLLPPTTYKHFIMAAMEHSFYFVLSKENCNRDSI